MPANPLHREAVPETPNRLGIDGIDFYLWGLVF